MAITRLNNNSITSITALPSGITSLPSSITSASGLSLGITEIDQWRLTANRTGLGVINSNLERVDNTGFGYKGTGMTESSGIFTFPNTGIWLITLNQLSTDLVRLRTEITTDNSTYSTAVNIYGDSSAQSGEAKFYFDVTDTSTHKTRFNWWNGGGTLLGDTNSNLTHFTFIRLADT